MEEYLALFENAIIRQSELVGTERARIQAKKAGLTVSRTGRVLACNENPMVVLLRLIRFFAEDGSLTALDACSPLIDKMVDIPAELEKVS